MAISSLASRTAIGLVAAGVTTAAGVGIWKLSEPQEMQRIKLPKGFRWLETEGNNDDEKWKRVSTENSKDIEGSKKLCLELKNKEFVGSIPVSEKNIAFNRCVWSDSFANTSR